MKNIEEIDEYKDQISVNYVNGFIYDYFAESERIVRQTRVDVERTFNEFPKFSNLSLPELNRWGYVLLTTLKSARYLDALNFGSNEGSTIAIARNTILNDIRGSEILFAWSDYKDIDNITGIPGPFWDYNINSIGVLSEVNPLLVPNYDHRMHPWWIESRDLEKDEICWVNNLNILNILSISAVMKVYIENGSECVGALSVQHQGYAIDNFLKEFQEVIYGGFLAIIDKDSEYFIGTVDDSGSKKDEKSGKMIRLKFEDHVDPSISTVGKLVKQKTNSYQNMSNIQSKFNTFVGSRLSMVRLSSFNVSNYNLLIVSIIPYKDVYKFMITSFWFLALTFLGFFIIVIIFTIFFGYKLILPLNQVISEMDKIRVMDLDSIKLKNSWFKEVVRLKSNFLLMVEKLKEYRKFLPTFLQEEEQKDSPTQETEETVKEKSIHQSSDSDSSCSSITKSNNTCLTEFMKRSKFQLGMKLRKFSILVVVFSNYFSQLKDNFVLIEEFVSKYSTLIDSFESNIKRGNLVEYEGGKMVFKFVSSAIALQNGIKILKDVENIFGVDYSVTIFVDFNVYITGVIGNDSLKKRIYEGALLDLVNIIATNPLAKRKILLTEQAVDTLIPQFRCLPFDIFKVNDEVIAFYSFEKQEASLAGEWMYELKHQKDLLIYKETIDALKELLRGNVEDAVKTFKKYSEKEKAIQRFVDICEEMQKQNISIQDLIKIANVKGSVFEYLYLFIRISKLKEISQSEIEINFTEDKTLNSN